MWFHTVEPFQYRKNREKGGSMIKQVYNLNEKSFRNYNGPDKGFKEKILFLDIMVEERPR